MSKRPWNKGYSLEAILSPTELKEVEAYRNKSKKKTMQAWRVKNKTLISEKARAYYRLHHPKVKFVTNRLIFKLATEEIPDFYVDEFEQKNPALYSAILVALERARHEGFKKAERYIAAEERAKNLQ